MAFDYFIGKSQVVKRALLMDSQEALFTGQVVKVQTAGGVVTEFDPVDVNNKQTYLDLCYSIANDPDFDASNPIDAACAANVRPGITRANFSGC